MMVMSLAFLDAEYFVEDANYWEKEMDMITLLSSLKQVDSEPYKQFQKGLETQYDNWVDPISEMASTVTSQVHANYIEEDEERAENAKENTVFRYL